MKFIAFVITAIFSNQVWAANPFEPFVGNYKVTKTIESTCTFKTSRECGNGGWNLNQLIEVWIFKDSDPKSIHFGKIYVGTKAWNATNFGEIAENGYSSYGLPQMVVGRYDNGEATLIVTNPSSLLKSWQISRTLSGRLEFTFERLTKGGHEKYVYLIERE